MGTAFAGNDTTNHAIVFAGVPELALTAVAALFVGAPVNFVFVDATIRFWVNRMYIRKVVFVVVVSVLFCPLLSFRQAVESLYIFIITEGHASVLQAHTSNVSLLILKFNNGHGLSGG
jgi:ABC-type uncharacterized transport system permease subunit